MTEPMDVMPDDYGSDRYDAVFLVSPPGIAPHGEWWDRLIAAPCPDCRANVEARFLGTEFEPDVAAAWMPEAWHITVAHDERCPTLLRHEAQ